MQAITQASGIWDWVIMITSLFIRFASIFTSPRRRGNRRPLLGLEDSDIFDPNHILTGTEIHRGFVLLWAAREVLEKLSREHKLAIRNVCAPYVFPSMLVLA